MERGHGEAAGDELYLDGRDARRFLDAEYSACATFLTEVGLAKKP